MDEQLTKARALALAIRDGLARETDDLEVSVSCTDRTSYAIENDLIVPVLECDAWSVTLRALKDGRLATAVTTSADARDSVGAMRRALGAAQPDPLASFAAPEPVDLDTRGADPALWALVDRPGEVRALAEALAKGTRAARPGKELTLEGEVAVGRSRRVFTSRHGGVVASAATSLTSSMMIEANDWDAWAGTTRPDDAVVTGLGRALVEGLPEREMTCAEAFGGAREVTAVLHPRLVEQLLRTLLLERVALDRVLSGLSSAQVGDAIAHESVSLDDDTGASHSLAGSVLDDEGVAGAKKSVLAGGALATLLSDRRSALARPGAESTGNGFRMPILAESKAEAPVRVGFGHLEMRAGATKRDKLVPGRTVLITDLLGMHSSNKATGAFNNPIQGGLVLDDGVPVARVKAGAWSATGNLYAMLRGVAALSEERLATGSALLPWMAAPLRVA